MKEYKRQFISLLLVLALTLSFSSCSRLFGIEEDGGGGGGAGTSDDSQDVEEFEISDDMSDEEYLEIMENAPVYKEEAEDADLTFRPATDLEFIGTWKATSGNAIYNYGNVDLTIRPGGVWKGNVAEEDLSGKWKLKKGSLLLSSEYFNATLSFTTNDKLIMQENRPDMDGDTILTTVLTKQ